jgi:transcriptional regulator
MYIAEHFQMSDADVARFLGGALYGNLVTVEPGTARPVATFLPWVFQTGPDRLMTHLSRVNTQWQHTETPALVILDLGHATVEAQWRAAHAVGQASPGTDYECLHVYGQLVADGSLAANIDSWDRLMAAHRSGLTCADMDSDYLERMSRSSVAVEVRVTEILAKSKLSQTDSSDDVATIIREMGERCPALAERVRRVGLPHAIEREAMLEGIRAGHRPV